uniref:(northern house mosquito) hypothetical protein n=1 Tax=Culex pipiens TaxID=7175 RepID=A0A8D8IA81_CULPI
MEVICDSFEVKRRGICLSCFSAIRKIYADTGNDHCSSQKNEPRSVQTKFQMLNVDRFSSANADCQSLQLGSSSFPFGHCLVELLIEKILDRSHCQRLAPFVGLFLELTNADFFGNIFSRIGTIVRVCLKFNLSFGVI